VVHKVTLTLGDAQVLEKPTVGGAQVLENRLWAVLEKDGVDDVSVPLTGFQRSRFQDWVKRWTVQELDNINFWIGR
jgi:hypothetical protein